MTALALLVLTAIVSIFWSGYVSSTLWIWFMVPLGVKAITYWHAVGLSALLSVFLGSRGLRKNEESVVEEIAYGLFASLVIPLICLGFGWVAKVNI